MLMSLPHVNKTVTDFAGIYTDISPVAAPLHVSMQAVVPVMTRIVP